MKWNPTRVSDIYILHENETTTPEKIEVAPISDLIQENSSQEEVPLQENKQPKVEEDMGLNKKEIEILEKLKENIPLDQILTMKDDSDLSYDESYDSEIEFSDELSIMLNSVPFQEHRKNILEIGTTPRESTSKPKPDIAINFQGNLTVTSRWKKIKLEKMSREELCNHALTLQWMIDNKDSLLLQYRQREQQLKEEITALCKQHGGTPSFGNLYEEEDEDDIEEKLDNFFLTDNALQESLQDMKKVESKHSPSLESRSAVRHRSTGKIEYEYSASALIQKTIGFVIENGSEKLDGVFENLMEKNSHYYLEQFNGKEHVNLICKDSPFGISIISISKEDTNGHFRVLIRTKKFDEFHLVPVSKIVKSGLTSITRKILKVISTDWGSVKYITVSDNNFKNELIQFENRTVTKKFKIGVLLCKDNQRKEEEMFGNESGSLLYDEFLSFLGEKINLQGWQRFTGGLDTKTETTGIHSVFSDWRGYEIMYHVSTLLPYSPADPQQVERKRHLGNDIVLIIFLDSSTPYKPTMISSNFIHVSIVIQVHQLNEDGTTFSYKMWVVSKDSVQNFEPQLPSPPIFEKNEKFRDFLLSKIVNAELACYRSERFSKKLEHARETYLKSIAAPFSK